MRLPSLNGKAEWTDRYDSRASFARLRLRLSDDPIGGLFIIVVAVSIGVGAALPRLRLRLVFIGLAAAGLSLVISGRLARGLPAAGFVQVASLVIAVALEIVAFRVLMPRLRPSGERVVMVGTLVIVGVHFIIMLPAFGWLVGALGLLLSLNAALAWSAPRYPLGLAWLADGIIKRTCGGVMISTSPLFH